MFAFKSLFFVIALALLSACAGETQPHVTDAWIRTAPPTAKVMAGYVSIKNPLDEPVALVAGSSDRYRKVELHMMRFNNGNMIMREVESFELPPLGELVLKPGSDHLMLIGPTHAPKRNDTINVTLQLQAANGDTISLDTLFTVRDTEDDR